LGCGTELFTENYIVWGINRGGGGFEGQFPFGWPGLLLKRRRLSKWVGKTQILRVLADSPGSGWHFPANKEAEIVFQMLHLRRGMGENGWRMPRRQGYGL
jgi:hypothetical protein